MSGNLGNILKAAKKDAQAGPPQDTPQTQPHSKTQRKPATTATVGKYRDEAYERLTVYVRKETKKAASRKWEDAGNRDISDLVQSLLSNYLST